MGLFNEEMINLMFQVETEMEDGVEMEEEEEVEDGEVTIYYYYVYYGKFNKNNK